MAYQRALALIDRALRCDAAGGGVPFSQVKALFGEMVDALDARIAAVSSALDNAFRFVEDAFRNGQEMLLLVTDLSVNRYGGLHTTTGCDATSLTTKTSCSTNAAPTWPTASTAWI